MVHENKLKPKSDGGIILAAFWDTHFDDLKTVRENQISS